MGNVYWDVFFCKDVSDLVIESFRNVQDLKMRPSCVSRLRVSLSFCGRFVLYTVLWVIVKAKDVVKCVQVLCCRYMQGASVLDPFSFIGNEVEFGFGRNSRSMVDE